MDPVLGNGYRLGVDSFHDSLGRVWIGADAAGAAVHIRLVPVDGVDITRLRRSRGLLTGLPSRYVVSWLEVSLVDTEPGDGAAHLGIFIASPPTVPTLRDDLADGLILDPAQAARLGADLALGMVSVHAAGLVHGGIDTDLVVRDGPATVRGPDASARALGLGVATFRARPGDSAGGNGDMGDRVRAEPSPAGDVAAIAAVARAALGPDGDVSAGQELAALLDELEVPGPKRTARDAAARLAALSNRLLSAQRRAGTPPGGRSAPVVAPTRAPVVAPAPVDLPALAPKDLPAPAPVAGPEAAPVDLPAPALTAEPEAARADLPAPALVAGPEAGPVELPASDLADGSAATLPAHGGPTRHRRRRRRGRLFAAAGALLLVAAAVTALIAALGHSGPHTGRSTLAGAAATGSPTAGAAHPSATPSVAASVVSLAQGPPPGTPAVSASDPTGGTVLQAGDISVHARPLPGLAGLDYNALLRALYTYCDYYSPPPANRSQHAFVGFSTGVSVNLYEDDATWSGSGAQDLLSGVRQSLASCSVLSATSPDGQVLGTYRITPEQPDPGLPGNQVGLLYQRVDAREPAVQAVFVQSGNRVVTVLAQGRNPGQLGPALSRAARRAVARLPAQ